MDSNAQLVAVLAILTLVGAYLGMTELAIGAAVLTAVMIVITYSKPAHRRHPEHEGHHAHHSASGPLPPPPVIVVQDKPSVLEMAQANIIANAVVEGSKEAKEKLKRDMRGGGGFR